MGSGKMLIWMVPSSAKKLYKTSLAIS
ncbi:uncharacterized protein G2W53_014706 [Senna tora]|uniref:Uncharacterized protein n=1 Tax=Senna tora TaxID=362788 RepID=A0A834WTQ0_9FABA|nr:uncharacterized protein G2W53_014706 [Senna tora]